MNSLLEIKSEIVNFWNIESSEQDKLIAKIQKYSDLKDENSFKNEVRNNFKQVTFSGISVVYEAMCKNPKKWNLFIKEEYERAFSTAETSENPLSILDCLEEFSIVDEDKVNNQEEIITILVSYLSNSKDILKYKSIWYLGDWINKKNAYKYSSVILKIQKKLTSKNWRIRFIAKKTLDDIGKLPNEYSVSFMDKIRAKIFPPDYK